jgi:hypothetical protein
MSPNSLPEGYRPSYAVCHEVSPICPVKATTLGYYPNEGLNIFFTIGFGLAALIALSVGVWKRTWGFSIAIVAGSILECVGMYCTHLSTHTSFLLSHIPHTR